jgi:hypothetical protein
MLGAVSLISFANVGCTQLTFCSDFTHDMARTRTFRWGEDGIAGVCDSHGLQNVAFSFWNEKEYVTVITAYRHYVDTTTVSS